MTEAFLLVGCGLVLGVLVSHSIFRAAPPFYWLHLGPRDVRLGDVVVVVCEPQQERGIARQINGLEGVGPVQFMFLPPSIKTFWRKRYGPRNGTR